MTPEQYQRVEQLYHMALELIADQRADFLDRECDGDREVLREVESLIANHEKAETFLIAPALEIVANQMAEENALLINQQVGHYRIISLLGKGGMGEVYLARDTQLGRKVALKLLPSRFTEDSDRLRRFIQEAKTASALNHPNIITIHEIGEVRTTEEIGREDGGHFIVTEFVDGQTLRQRMDGAELSLTESLEVAIQVASALSAAHAAGITHRDIKPENVMVRADGLVKVLDFGLAKLTEGAGVVAESDAVAMEAETESGVVMGTPQYMSPEQARGQKVDGRTDIFSLGVMLYEMVTGRKPFKGETTSDVIAAILMSEPAPLAQSKPGLPAELQRIVSRALAKEREARYQSANDFELDLKNVKSGAGKLKRNKLGAAVMIAMVLAVALTAAYLLRERLYPAEEPAAERITLAVLPFDTSNAPEEMRFLGIGIPDAIIMRLSNVRRLRPRPTSAVLRYENQSFNPQEVGQALASEYLVTGVVLSAGEQLRVSAQLIKAKDGALVWGDSYDVARQDLLRLQDKIAEQVSAALKIHLTAAERERFYRRYTDNPAAYELYLKGQAHLRRRGKEEKLAAVEAFDNALRLDQQNALAHAGLAAACGALRHSYSTPSEVRMWDERAKQAAGRALELDRYLAEAHEAMAALYRYTDFEWERTIEESRKALDLNSNLGQPHLYIARAYYHLGLLEHIEPEVRAALEINPEHRSEASDLLVYGALYSGRYDEAVARHEGAGRAESDFPELYYHCGKREIAEKALIEELRKDDNVRWQLEGKALLASFLAARGARAQAKELLREVTSAGETFHHASYNIGAAYAQLGDKANARMWLARAAYTGLPCYPWYELDPLLQPLRGDPEFQRFMEGLKRSWEGAKKRYGSEPR